MLDYSKITRNGPWMLTASGRRFWPLDPHPDDISLEDIGWALSQSCRYGGQVPPPFFYSVAEHSVLLSEYWWNGIGNIQNIDIAEEHDLLLAKWSFIHDFAEAYIGDVIKPIKPLLTEFKPIEINVETCIFKKFGFTGGIPEEVNWADKAICADEQLQLWPLEFNLRDDRMKRPRLHIQIECLQPVQAYNRFMRRAAILGIN